MLAAEACRIKPSGDTLAIDMLMSWLLLCGFLGLAGCGCSSTSPAAVPDDAAPDSSLEEGLSRCIGNWPERPPFEWVAPIEGVTPQVLWVKSFEAQLLQTGLALAGERIAFAAYQSLFIVDLEGNLVRETPTAEFDAIYAGPAADLDGNFYFSGVRAYSVDSEGEPRWSHRFGENQSFSYEFTWGRKFVIDPAGVGYVSATDGMVYALSLVDGDVLWSKDVGLYQGTRPVAIGPGVGDVIFVSSRERVRVLDKDTGEDIGDLPEVDGIVLAPGKAGYDLGIAASRIELVDVIQMSPHAIDRCGKLKWSLPRNRDWVSSVFLPDDSQFIYERDLSAGATLYRSIISPTGKRTVGPVEGVVPNLLGADGVSYALSCKDNISTVTAIDLELTEIWKVDLGSPCVAFGAVLSDTGVLYVARQMAGDGPGGEPPQVQLIAVQTTSPGLANTSWPHRNHDNRGTDWLAPIE